MNIHKTNDYKLKTVQYDLLENKNNKKFVKYLNVF